MVPEDLAEDFLPGFTADLLPGFASPPLDTGEPQPLNLASRLAAEALAAEARATTAEAQNTAEPVGPTTVLVSTTTVGQHSSNTAGVLPTNDSTVDHTSIAPPAQLSPVAPWPIETFDDGDLTEAEKADIAWGRPWLPPIPADLGRSAAQQERDFVRRVLLSSRRGRRGPSLGRGAEEEMAESGAEQETAQSPVERAELASRLDRVTSEEEFASWLDRVTSESVERVEVLLEQ